MKADLDRSMSSSNSNLRKPEQVKKPKPIHFDDIDDVNCEDINPIVSFQAEENNNQKYDQVENTPGFPEGNPTHKTQQMFSEQSGRKIVFDASEEMVFESDTSERKSLDICNNKRIAYSGKRLKTPTPQQSLDHQGDDEFFLNKSVEIKQRSRNKPQRLSYPNRSNQNKT